MGHHWIASKCGASRWETEQRPGELRAGTCSGSGRGLNRGREARPGQGQRRLGDRQSAAAGRGGEEDGQGEVTWGPEEAGCEGEDRGLR